MWTDCRKSGDSKCGLDPIHMCDHHRLQYDAKAMGCLLREGVNMSGEKRDKGKLRYDLIPAYPLQELARVYTIGSVKYGDNNWREGIPWSRIIAALMRHLEAWRMGSTVDPDDGQHPLASVAWCALTLMEYERSRPEFDDRHKRGYVPGKPCPECGYVCIMPDLNPGVCCECHQDAYDGTHHLREAQSED